jgi:glucokinase
MNDVGDHTARSWVVVGLDNGGNCDNATVLDQSGQFLVDGLVESPSRVTEGPRPAIEALTQAYDDVLAKTGNDRSAVRAVGLDSPGPASADGVISSLGATNFIHPDWRGFDLRRGLEDALRVPVHYNNDGNAAALYAHHRHFGALGDGRSSVSVIVGTGLGGGVVESGRLTRGAAGMAGEFGHVYIPVGGLLEPGQPVPHCNCGFDADAESIASLTGIEKNLLPYWLTRFPNHPLAALPLATAAKQVRGLAEAGDELALSIFRQQAMAIGRLFTIVSNCLDPDAYFLGGGVVESAPHFRDWFLGTVRQNLILRAEQADTSVVLLVPDLDMAGARGSALAAWRAVVHH